MFVDGVPITVDGRAYYQTFGRLPYNDAGTDTTYRNHTYTVNKTVAKIELQSWDISGHSEILIDDLRILGDHSSFSYAHAFNLTADWSSTQNPNDAWSYNNGTTPLPNAVADWMGIPGETFWSYPFNPSNEEWDATPAWTRIRNATDSWAPSGDLAIGDVVVHSTNVWEREGSANVTWTTPGAGTIDISGSVWDAFHAEDRDDSWGLALNGTILAERPSIRGTSRNATDASVASNLAEGQSLNAVSVQRGDIFGVLRPGPVWNRTFRRRGPRS